MNNPTPPLLLKPVEAARELGVTVQTLANWRCQERGPAWVSLGSAVRYRRDTIIAFVEANTHTAMPPTRKRGAAK